MGMFDLLRGKSAAPTPRTRNSKLPPSSTQFSPSQVANSGGATASVHSVRKDLLKLVMRETLTRNGIPQHWLAVDLLRTTSPRREQGIHVRFLMREWHPQLLQHGVALEQEFAQRLLLLDPLASNWLMGFSWQFALPDVTVCPPMPHPGSWTAPAQSDQAPLVEAKPSSYGDVIAGPTFVPRPLDDVRADLEQLLALRDEDMKRHAESDAFAATRPATL